MQKQWQKGISALKTVNMFIYCGQNEAQNLWFAEASLRKVCEKQIVRAEIRVKKATKSGKRCKMREMVENCFGAGVYKN